MADISELTQSYIENNFPEVTQQKILEAISVLDRFEVRFYEDDLEGLITMEGMADKEDIKDLFLEKISRYMHSVLEEHKIFLNEDHDVSLAERVEIAQFLLLVQDLEDKSLLAYRIYSDDSPKNILTSLLGRYSYLEEFRAMEIIDRVDRDIIDAMRNMCKDTELSVEMIDSKQKEEWKIFSAFINKSVETIGDKLVEKGYSKIDFPNLYSLEKSFIDRCLQESEANNRPQAAVDAISLMLMCKDTYLIPLMEFDKQLSIVFLNMDNVTAIRHIATQILKDYEIFKEAYLKKQQLEEGGQNG